MARNIVVTPMKITLYLLGIVAILLLANFVVIYIRFVLGLQFEFIKTFYFNSEANIPSFYSASAILFSAILLFLIGNLGSEREKGQSTSWKLLGYIFTFLAIDEFVSIHENLTGMIRNLIGNVGNGYLHYAWIIPYVAVFGSVFVYLLRFFFRLPAATKCKFMMAGILFIGGAVGMEMLSGRYEYLHGREGDLNYAMLVTAEELIEMVGIIVFIYALLKYCVENATTNRIRLGIEVNEDVPVSRQIRLKVRETLRIE
jgi:hypothetical protein